MVMRVPIPPVILILSISIAIILNQFFPLLKLIDYPYNLSGFVVMGIGFILVFLSIKSLKDHKTTTNPNATPTALVTKGPYNFSRHPMYLGSFFITIGVAIFLSSLTALVGPLIYVSLINKYVIPFEEMILQKTFGSNYEKYKRQVRRWI